jgi:hypothetical protein
MEVTLDSDSYGRVVGTIAHNGAQATVTGSHRSAAMTDFQVAVDSAINNDHGECFWHEALGEYRWLFRRDGNIMRVVILRSSGTLTGWESCFWAECDSEEFRTTMSSAIQSYARNEPHG